MFSNFIGRYWKGFWAPLKALRMILTSPQLFTLVLVPLAVNIGLYILFFSHGSAFLNGLIEQAMNTVQGFLPEWLSWLNSVAHFALKLFAWVTLIIIAAISFTLVSGIIAAPFNDYISKHTERIYLKRQALKSGVPFKPGPEINLRFKDTIKLEMRRTMVLIFGGIFTLIVGVIPLMQVPAICMGALLLSFEYFGYPFSRKSDSLSDLWGYTLKQLPVSLGLGCFLLLMMAIPFASMIYIPLAVVAASRLHTEIRTN